MPVFKTIQLNPVQIAISEYQMLFSLPDEASNRNRYILKYETSNHNTTFYMADRQLPPFKKILEEDIQITIKNSAQDAPPPLIMLAAFNRKNVSSSKPGCYRWLKTMIFKLINPSDRASDDKRAPLLSVNPT